LTPAPGEIWLADAGRETRREVFILSDPRFHRLAERAIVAPIVAAPQEGRRPWHVDVEGDRVAAVHQLSTLSVDRLLERVAVADVDALLRARRAARHIVG
jgi:mRNA-degrading endonuclease toxin of MazEF toxin-antitoxin module